MHSSFFKTYRMLSQILKALLILENGGSALRLNEIDQLVWKVNEDQRLARPFDGLYLYNNCMVIITNALKSEKFKMLFNHAYLFIYESVDCFGIFLKILKPLFIIISFKHAQSKKVRLKDIKFMLSEQSNKLIPVHDAASSTRANNQGLIDILAKSLNGDGLMGNLKFTAIRQALIQINSLDTLDGLLAEQAKNLSAASSFNHSKEVNDRYYMHLESLPSGLDYSKFSAAYSKFLRYKSILNFVKANGNDVTLFEPVREVSVETIDEKVVVETIDEKGGMVVGKNSEKEGSDDETDTTLMIETIDEEGGMVVGKNSEKEGSDDETDTTLMIETIDEGSDDETDTTLMIETIDEEGGMVVDKKTEKEGSDDETDTTLIEDVFDTQHDNIIYVESTDDESDSDDVYTRKRARIE